MRGTGPEAISRLEAGDVGGAEALLFDFDGVLADSEPLFRESWNEALSGWGIEIPEEEYFLRWTSLGEGLRGHVSRHGHGGIDIEAAERLQKRIYRSFCELGRVELMPGARDVLDALSRGPFASSHAIASNTDGDLVELILGRAGALRPRITGGAGLPHKPAPDIFLEAARSLGVRPSASLVFEDAWKGLEAASRGGFPSVLVRAGTNAGMKLEADYEIEGIASLLPLLERLSP